MTTQDSATKNNSAQIFQKAIKIKKILFLTGQIQKREISKSTRTDSNT